MFFVEQSRQWIQCDEQRKENGFFVCILWK